MSCLAPFARRAKSAVAVLSLEAAVAAVARHRKLPPESLRQPGNTSSVRARGTFASTPTTLARREALYLANVALGVPTKRLAAAASLTPKSVRQALARVENARTDAAYDRHLDELELELLA